ncbi:hypothetical protein DWW31_08545, partial [Clostridium sp. AF15-17LB]
MKKGKAIVLSAFMVLFLLADSLAYAADINKQDEVIDMESEENKLRISDLVIQPEDESLVGETVNLSVEAAGGKGGYEYQYYLINDSEEDTREEDINDVIIRDYNAQSQFEWEPEEPDEYKIGVRVRDSSGKTAELEEPAIYTVKAQEAAHADTSDTASNAVASAEPRAAALSIVSLTASPLSEVALGGTVTLTAKKNGGQGTCQYQYYVIRDGKEIVIG